jgi:hypothetical protein
VGRGDCRQRRGAPVAVAFDPTNARRASANHLSVAVGRATTTVMPTSGGFEREAPGIATSRKRLEVLSLNAASSNR